MYVTKHPKSIVQCEECPLSKNHAYSAHSKWLTDTLCQPHETSFIILERSEEQMLKVQQFVQ